RHDLQVDAIRDTTGRATGRLTAGPVPATAFDLFQQVVSDHRARLGNVMDLHHLGHASGPTGQVNPATATRRGTDRLDRIGHRNPSQATARMTSLAPTLTLRSLRLRGPALGTVPNRIRRGRP